MAPVPGKGQRTLATGAALGNHSFPGSCASGYTLCRMQLPHRTLPQGLSSTALKARITAGAYLADLLPESWQTVSKLSTSMHREWPWYHLDTA